jgi:hypothetical protein
MTTRPAVFLALELREVPADEVGIRPEEWNISRA